MARFYLGLEEQCNDELKAHLLKFNKYELFEILSKGYQNECIEASIINEFINEVKLNLDTLRRSITEFLDQANSSNSIETLIDDLNNIRNIILYRKLKEYQESQFLLHHRHRISHNINNLQIVFGQCWQIIEKLNQIIDHKVSGNQLCYKEALLNIKERFVSSSFIIEEQPPQVMKTNTNFTVSLRWILGDPEHVSHSSIACYILSGVFLFDTSITLNLTVSFTFIAEQQAKQFYQNPCLEPYLQDDTRKDPSISSGDISNHVSSFEYNPENSFICMAKFR